MTPAPQSQQPGRTPPPTPPAQKGSVMEGAPTRWQNWLSRQCVKAVNSGNKNRMGREGSESPQLLFPSTAHPPTRAQLILAPLLFLSSGRWHFRERHHSVSQLLMLNTGMLSLQIRDIPEGFNLGRGDPQDRVVYPPMKLTVYFLNFPSRVLAMPLIFERTYCLQTLSSLLQQIVPI